MTFTSCAKASRSSARHRITPTSTSRVSAAYSTAGKVGFVDIPALIEEMDPDQAVRRSWN